jgi:uncharacterized protein (DUF2461 family)
MCKLTKLAKFELIATEITIDPDGIFSCAGWWQGGKPKHSAK